MKYVWRLTRILSVFERVLSVTGIQQDMELRLCAYLRMLYTECGYVCVLICTCYIENVVRFVCLSAHIIYRMWFCLCAYLHMLYRECG